MKVKVFMMTAGHNSEREVLRSMHDGIESQLIPKDKEALRQAKRINRNLGRGLSIDYEYGEKFSACDVAVMFGSWKPERSNIHHAIRSNIVEKAKTFICIETPLLGRNFFKGNEYYRVGINGFLNRAATFGSERVYSPDRFNALNLKFNGWNSTKEGKVIVAMQLAGDASLRNNDINEWVWDTVNSLRQHTNRPIEIRTHPGVSEKGWGNHDELFRRIMFAGIANVQFVNGKEVSWQNQLNGAYCVVAYTSGLAIDAVVAGVPVIACDEGCFAWNVGERKLQNIEKLNLADTDTVRQWLHNLAYCQWTPEEMESGKTWNHLKSSIDSIVNQET